MSHRNCKVNCLTVALLLCFNLTFRYIIALPADINSLYLNSLLKNVNFNIDPCEDFYEYACGSWQQNYAETKEYVDMAGYMDYKTNQQLLATLRAAQNATMVNKKLWQYYESCEKLKNPALNTYLELVQSELQMEWPILRNNWPDNWQNATNFDWLQTIAILRAYGLNGVFLTQNVNVRPTNGSHHILQLHQHIVQQKLELKADNVAGILTNFGLSLEESKNLTASIMQLEEEMFNLTLVNYVGFNQSEIAENFTFTNSYEEHTIQELIEKIPSIKWEKYFEIILNRSVDVMEERVQTLDLQPDYFIDLQRILQNTDNETLAYYIMLKFMYKLAADLPVGEDKSMHCIKHLRGYMPLAINYLHETYLFQNQRSTIEQLMQNMFNRLRSNFVKLLTENHLSLNVAEHLFITSELNSMKLKIGNIPQAISNEFVENYYANLDIKPANFYANHLAAIRFLNHQQLQKLKNQATNAAQHFYIHEAETASSSSPIKLFDNAILLPYGYLQLPLFHANTDALLQYSLLGFMLAHEIVHAFDLFHIVYDMHGNYNALGAHIEQHFNEFILCLQQEKNDILSENMADITGLRLAYQTYFLDVANSLNSSTSNNYSKYNLSEEQLFFINSVQFLCANMRKIDNMNVQSLNLEHEMHNKRVRENWAQFEGFGEAFNCGKDSKMQPAERCRLW